MRELLKQKSHMAIHFINGPSIINGALFNGQSISSSIHTEDPIQCLRQFNNLFSHDGFGDQLHEFKVNNSFLNNKFMNRYHFMEILGKSENDVYVQIAWEITLFFTHKRDFDDFINSKDFCSRITLPHSNHTIREWLMNEGFIANREYRLINLISNTEKTEVICESHLATLLITRFGLPSEVDNIPF